MNNLSKSSAGRGCLHQETGVEEERRHLQLIGWLTSEHCSQAVWEAAEQDGGDDGDCEGEGGEGGDQGAEDPAGAWTLHWELGLVEGAIGSNYQQI